MTIEKLRKSIAMWLGLDVVDESALAMFKALKRNISPVVQSYKTRLVQSAFCRWANGICQGRIKAAGTTEARARFDTIFGSENGLPVAEDLIVSRLFPKNIALATAWTLIQTYKTKAAIRELFVSRLGKNAIHLADSVYFLGKYAQAIVQYTEQTKGGKARVTVDMSTFEITAGD